VAVSAPAVAVSAGDGLAVAVALSDPSL
jgi:hypothetical protein